jgi:hypothetical protein
VEPSGEWEVKWAGVEPCETMGPSHSQAHEPKQPETKEQWATRIPKAKPITIKAKTQPNDPKPKMVWQPRVNGSQKIKNSADRWYGVNHSKPKLIECRSTVAIPNRNSRRPPALFRHHRRHPAHRRGYSRAR